MPLSCLQRGYSTSTKVVARHGSSYLNCHFMETKSAEAASVIGGAIAIVEISVADIYPLEANPTCLTSALTKCSNSLIKRSVVLLA